MRAVRFARVGGPQEVSTDDVPAPAAPTGDEVEVEVAASSINGTDLGLRRGDVRLATLGRLPFTLGFDLAGTVLRCGPAVTAFRSGDHVVALLGHAGGAQADRVVLRQRRAALAPASRPLTEAGALPLAGLTALQALHGRAGLPARPPGRRRVLVVGASGGIGSFAVQLAKLTGAHVTGTGSARSLDHIRAMGADEAVDRHRDDPFTSGERWDVVLDAPGVHTFAQVRRSLAADGVLVSTRPISRDALRGALRGSRATGQVTTAVATRARSQDLTQLVALVDDGRLHLPVTETYPAELAAQAHARAEGDAVGKVVLVLSGGRS